MVKIYVCAVHAHVRWLASETEVSVFALFLSVELLRLRMISSNDSMRVYMINVGTACACEQPPPPSLPHPHSSPQLCVLMSVVPFATSVCVTMVFFEVCYSSVAHSPAHWRKMLQTGPAMSVRRGGKHKGFLLSILYISTPMATGTKKSTSTGRVGACLVLPSHHPASTHLAPICPAVLAFYMLSYPLFPL